MSKTARKGERKLARALKPDNCKGGLAITPPPNVRATAPARVPPLHTLTETKLNRSTWTGAPKGERPITAAMLLADPTLLDKRRARLAAAQPDTERTHERAGAPVCPTCHLRLPTGLDTCDTCHETEGWHETYLEPDYEIIYLD